MSLTRRDIMGRILCAATMTAWLGACESPQTAMNPTAGADQKIGDICAETLSYDVTGPYYAGCRNYLLRHSQPAFVAVNDRSAPAEQRACQEIGLAKGTTEYKSCVQELSLLDISAAHL